MHSYPVIFGPEKPNARAPRRRYCGVSCFAMTNGRGVLCNQWVVCMIPGSYKRASNNGEVARKQPQDQIPEGAHKSEKNVENLKGFKKKHI